MTPRQRSVLVSLTALLVAAVGVYLGISALEVQGGGQGGGEGQFIANSPGPAADDLAVGATSTATTATTATDQPIGGIGLASEPGLPSPGTPPVTLPTSGSTSSTAASTAATDPSTTAETTGPTEAPTTETTAEASSSTTEPSSTSTTAAAGLDAVELEIVRLTNELRADPAGPLARQGPMPSCVDDDFYGITIDPATGHPTPVSALSLSEPVSLQMSRPWAVDMDARDTMSHRPTDSQLAIYGQLGINVSAIGENVAWFQGFPDSQAATVHFEGWRESDSGHYCALIAGSYTHIGVGHHRGAAKSWGVQNFYSLQ